MKNEWVPKPGEWPVDPQQDVPIADDRIWVDGCFDFAHHGHAGAMLQARRLGSELVVGVHSDEAIMENKGPTVMTLQERIAAVDACRWATQSIPHAPYVTSLPWISHYGCRYVVHGDDITSDSSGNDCYRYVKAAGRFKIVKRTPGISTTDLVGRMLLCTRGHFIQSLESVLAGIEGAGSVEERKVKGKEMTQRIKDYATDESGHQPGCEIWSWRPEHSRRRKIARAMTEPPTQHMSRRHTSHTSTHRRSKDAEHSNTIAGGSVGSAAADSEGKGTFKQMVEGKPPLPGQRIVYVDGGFDLFSSGHIEFLRKVTELERELGKQRGWYDEAAVQERVRDAGEDYGPCYVVAGVHDDEVINRWKGFNYPIMNLFERSLCVLQCRYIHALIFSAPFFPTSAYLHTLPFIHAPDPSVTPRDANEGGLPAAVYHGPTSFMPMTTDPYADAKRLGLFHEAGKHAFAHVNAGEIVERILKNRSIYEARQRAKGAKGVAEEAAARREKEAMDRKFREIERMYGV